MKREKVEKGLFGAVVLAALLACNSGGSSSSTGGSKPSQPAGPAISVTAKQLFEDYQKNEVSADDKYKGKLLKVSGTVHSIDKDAFDNMILRLATPNQFMSVAATMNVSEKAKLGQMAKGQAATVQCTGGGMVIKSPILKDCSF